MEQMKKVSHVQVQFVENVLGRHFPQQRWQISRPKLGSQKETFIVHGEQLSLFVKFDAPTVAWSRLAEIEATPPMLARGYFAERPYIIQAFWGGQHPIRRWYGAHSNLVASFVRSYHTDEPLRELLHDCSSQSCVEHLWAEIGRIEHTLTKASAKQFSTPRFQHTFALFKAQATSLSRFRFVPIHADPNSANILVRSDQMIMVDWDDVTLSDPMRDIGLLLWWYFPQDSWLEFSRIYGAEFDRDRIFWWVARQSLEVALYFEQKGKVDMVASFLKDFYHAVGHHENPQIMGQ